MDYNSSMEHAFNTGAISKKDYRNFKVKEIEKFLPQTPVIPEVYLPSISDFPIFYQGKIGSCVGHAGAWFKMFIDSGDTGQIVPYSPRFLYTLCKMNDGIPNTEGTYPITAVKMLQKYGVCSQTLLANNVDMTHDQYKDPNNLTVEAYEEAENAKVNSYAEITDKSFENLKKEIFRNEVVMLCVKHGGEFYTVDNEITWDPDKLFPLKKIYPIVSGHEIVAYGYDNDNIYFVNSFSDRWGKRGIGWFSRDYVDRISEAHIVVDLPTATIIELREKRKTIMYKIIAILTQMVDLLKK